MQTYQLIIVLSVLAACTGCVGGKRAWQPLTATKSKTQTAPATVSQRMVVVPATFTNSGLYRFTYQGRRFSIPITVLSEAKVDQSCTLFPIEDRLNRFKLVERVKTVLTRFGDPFLGKLVPSGKLNVIEVVSDLKFKDEETGIWGGFYFPSTGTVVVKANRDFAETIAHELCHSFDYASGFGDDDHTWNQANPPGSSYAGKPVLGGSAAPAGFVRAYSLSSPLEDRATVLQELLGGNGTRDALLNRALEDEILKEKIDILQSRMPEGRLPWMCPVESYKFGRATWSLAGRKGKLVADLVGSDEDGLVRFQIRPEGFDEIRRVTYRLHGGFERPVVSVKGDDPLEIVCWKEARVTATVYTATGPVSTSVRIDL